MASNNTNGNASEKKTKPNGKDQVQTPVLTREQLDHFKQKLQTERQRVLTDMGQLQSSNLKQSIADQSGEISRYSYHLGDTASLSYGREFSMGLAERQQKYLEQVDEALQRIADGTYGVCRVTGEPIPVERLEEVPVAKYSVKGKEILARKRR
ncbi:MAG: molecular chaperone DnaK [Chitinivibrionales bacterium]|nr:molecular chaperone DnaK [Chitinivibrionales bacterium]MBD3355968.1 molecular chaperone DnaK [Chitinivibrionales bacterium]